MEEAVQLFAGGRNHRMQELISGTGEALSHPADWLLKVNLPPLMGRRDAALDIADRLICEGDFASCSSRVRFSAYWQISKLLKKVCADSRQILLMINSPDTRDRERRMLAHCAMLDSLGASLANFIELHSMTMNDIFRDAMNTINSDEAQKIIQSFSSVEEDLLCRMRESFRRSHHRLVRYRTYVGKNFSAANAERYRRAYAGCVKHNRTLMEQLGVNLPKEIQLQN